MVERLSDERSVTLNPIDAFHLAVGRAIHAWGIIESRLEETFAVCLSFSPPRGAGFIRVNPIASSVLNALTDMSAKLRLVTTAVRAALQDLDHEEAFADEWAANHRKIAGLEQYLLSLVHWAVVQELDEDGRLKQVLLRPRRPKSTDAQPLTIAAVETCERRFLAAAQRLLLLNERLAGDYDRQRAHVIEFAEQLSSANDRDVLIQLLNQKIEQRTVSA